jgi:SAM-dependent methyltransferase
MKAIDWFGSLPTQDRADIIVKRAKITANDKQTMLAYGHEYFDGGNPWGYGSYKYDGRFQGVVQKIIKHYGLTKNSHVLDIGCAKGYLLYEFYRAGIHNVHGLDISDYAIAQVPNEIQGKCFVGSAHDLSRFKDKSIDFVLTKDVIHNLVPEFADKAVSEIVRVGKGAAFIQLGSYDTPHQKECLKAWVITIKTVRSNQEWTECFKRFGYQGDYNFLCHDYKLDAKTSATNLEQEVRS